jgi:hypothetical protein
MAGNGTGYPNHFECSKARLIYYGDRSSTGEPVARTTRERAAHVITLTGRTRPTPRNGKGHPRKSWTTREYRCTCGHVGWSCHKDLERLEARS